MTTETPVAWHPHTLRFARTERLTVTATAVLELLSSTPRSDLEILGSLRDAVTEWVTHTDSGKALWHYSSEELNIGDLLGADALNDAELLGRLESRGLRVVRGVASVQERAFAYDALLVHAGHDLERDDEPDEALEANEV